MLPTKSAPNNLARERRNHRLVATSLLEHHCGLNGPSSRNTAALHAAVLAWLYLAGLQARLVAQEVAASTDDQGGAVHKFYRSYLSSKHGYWPCQDALGDGAVGIRKSEGDCTVATLDAVYADEPLGALGKGFLGQ